MEGERIKMCHGSPDREVAELRHRLAHQAAATCPFSFFLLSVSSGTCSRRGCRTASPSQWSLWAAEAAVFSYLDLASVLHADALQDWFEPRFYWNPRPAGSAAPASATTRKEGLEPSRANVPFGGWRS